MLDLILPEFFQCFKPSNQCIYYHYQKHIFKIQSIQAQIFEHENHDDISGRLWKNKSEGLVDVVILAVGFQLEY